MNIMNISIADIKCSFKLYPNPTSDKVMLEYNLNEGETGSIQIYTITGIKVLNYDFTADKNALTFSTAQLKTGIYFYSIVVNNELRASDKLVIIK